MQREEGDVSSLADFELFWIIRCVVIGHTACYLHRCGPTVFLCEIVVGSSLEGSSRYEKLLFNNFTLFISNHLYSQLVCGCMLLM